MEFVVLGNPDNRRVRYYQEALEAHGQPPARLCRWHHLLQRGPEALGLDEAEQPIVLRLDSPEGDRAASSAFLEVGAAALEAGAAPKGEALSAEEARRRPFDGSGLRYMRQRFLGFMAVLSQLESFLETSAAHIVCTHPPADVALMSHKGRCHRYLSAAGIAQPSLLAVEQTDELLQHIAATGEGAFVKLWHGSSAAGIAAVSPRSGGFALQTSTVMAADGPFSSLQLRHHTDEAAIRRILDFLYAEGAHTERWLPKLTIGPHAREFDLRVIVIAGRARHLAVRVSSHESPMTNLHFGNDRGYQQDVIDLVGPTRWADAMALCEAAAACFPDSLCVGLDLMFDREARPLIIEANPFGDLLPGIRSEGQTTYDAQVTAAIERASQA